MRRSVGNGGLLCLIFAVVITLTTTVFCGPILRVMQTPDDIFLLSRAYIFVIFAGIPVTLLYNYLSGILRALGDSKSPVLFLMLSSILNIGMDILFISAFHSGVVGAAIATVIAQAISGLVCLLYIAKKVPLLWMKKEDWKPNKTVIRILCLMGIPMGLQYSITALGSIMLQSAVNSLGTEIVAATAGGVRLDCFFCCPYEALGATMATYCGQNVGAGKLDRLGKGILSCVVLGMGYYIVIAVIVQLCAPTLALLFLDSSEVTVIALMSQYIRIVTRCYCLLTLLNVLRFAIQGMGFSQLAMLAGLMEMLARGLDGLLLVPRFGYIAACLSSPLARLLADLFLVPACTLCVRHLKHSANTDQLAHI